MPTIDGRDGRRCGWLVLVAVVAGAACAPLPLADARLSADVLGRSVLEGIARRDISMLRRLALSEAEFRAHVWPSLPAARPERNLPFGYVWRDLHQKSETYLNATLGEHGGRAYDLVGVRFEDLAAEYAGFRVHRTAIFDVRGPGGAAALRLCGSFLEKDGGWKVFSYVVE